MSPELYFYLFFSQFHTGISLIVMSITTIMATCVSGYLRYRRSQQVILPWIAACLFLMLYTTVIGRLNNGDHDTVSLQIRPFWSIHAIQDGYIETLYEKIYNVLFFVPYGLLLGFRSFRGFRGFRSFKSFRGFRVSVLIGFLTSVTIELLQLITRTGTCETDDVICNTFGCAIGAVIGALTMTMRGTSYDDDALSLR